MKKFIKKHAEKFVLAGGIVVVTASSSFAGFSMPSLPVTDLETAGAAVAALVAAFVVIKMAVRMIKGA